jgi:molybdopterin converting factor small subunit
VRVTVRVFARLREIVGAGELAVEVDPPATIAAVWRALASAHPGVEPYARAVSAARNLEYARLETSVEDGDEIAFLPPVSGGAGTVKGTGTGGA